MVSAAYDAYHHGDLDEADDLARDVVDATHDVDPSIAAWAQMARANIAASRGRLDEALAILDDVASWPGSVFDRHTIHSIIALYTALTDDHDKAVAAAQVGLDGARELGQPSALALGLYTMGMVLAETDPGRGRLYCEQSIAMTEQGASDVVYANALGTLALISARSGDVHAALDALRRSIAWADELVLAVLDAALSTYG